MLKNLLDYDAAKSLRIVNHLNSAFLKALVAGGDPVNHEQAIEHLGPTLQAAAFEPNLDFKIGSE